MKNLLKWVINKKPNKRKSVNNTGGWMREQMKKMEKMNQGVVSMTLGRP